MILNKSESYWSTGITVRCRYHGTRRMWGACLDFYDDGFADDKAPHRISTEGTLRTRYLVADGDAGLRAAVSVLLQDAENLGIEFRRAPDGETPYLYYKSDGEDPNWPPPEGWRQILNDVAAEIGWSTPYPLIEAAEAYLNGST